MTAPPPAHTPEDTAELRVVQERRARDERRRQRAEPPDERAHDRRAEKAAYLAARLAERERTEQERER